jgi:anti-sigma-K factor RskA
MPELHLLTGAYALDALDDVERAGFERHLRSCESCPDEVRDFREAAAALAERVATPAPERLRARVLAEVSRTRQVTVGRAVPRRRPAARQLIATAAAAVVLAGSAGLGGIAWQSHRSANDARVVADRAAQRAAELTRVMTDPGRIEAVGSPSVGGRATVVAAGGRAVIATRALPAAPTGKQYQLWVIRGEVIRSAGLLDLRAGDGQALVPGVDTGDVVAVSVEPRGGSKQPTTTPVVAIPVA